MDPRRQWIAVIVIIVILDMAAISLSSTTGKIVSSESRPFSVSEVFDNVLLGEDVYVEGRVTKVLPDYISKKGFRYQQFMISDAEEEIKVFCSIKYGKADIREGDEVVFDGEFQKYYNTYEISGFCSEIAKINI